MLSLGASMALLLLGTSVFMEASLSIASSVGTKK